MLIATLVLTNLVTFVALCGYIYESIANEDLRRETQRNLRDAADKLEGEWERLDRELARNRRLNREIAAMGGSNRIKDYL
jgi:hypothetical protein